MTNYPTTVVSLTGMDAAAIKVALDAVCVNGIYLVSTHYDGTDVFALCQAPTN